MATGSKTAQNDQLLLTCSYTTSSTQVSYTLTLKSRVKLSLVQGTLQLGGTKKSVSSTSLINANTNIASKSLTINFNGASSDTETMAFYGTISYDTEEGIETTSTDVRAYVTADRPVSVSINCASSVTLGSALSITTANGWSSAMTWSAGGSSGSVQTVGNTTFSWTPLFNTFAGKYGATVSSISCTLSWCGATKTISLVLPQNASTKPSISGVAVSAVNPLGSAYVQGKSKATVTVTASGNYSATIKSYSITVNGETINTTSNTATSGLLNTAGSNTATVTVIDSRGFTNSATSPAFTVNAYASPTIGSVNLYRSDSAGNASNSGTYVTFNFTPTIANINGNEKKYYLQWRNAGGSSFSNDTSGDLSSYTGAQSIRRSGYNATTAYEVRVAIKDSYETVYSGIFNIPTASVLMDFNSAGTGGGIGMYTQAAGYLDVAWKVRARDGLNIPFTGTGVSSTSYVAVFDGSKNVVPMAFSYFNQGGSNVTLTKLGAEKDGVPCTTTYKYSGLSVSIPAGCVYSITFWAYYSAVSPGGVILSESSSSITGGNVRAEAISSSMPNAPRVTGTYSGWNDSSSAKVFYLWGKTASASGNIGFQYAGFAMKTA